MFKGVFADFALVLAWKEKPPLAKNVVVKKEDGFLLQR